MSSVVLKNVVFYVGIWSFFVCIGGVIIFSTVESMFTFVQRRLSKRGHDDAAWKVFERWRWCERNIADPFTKYIILPALVLWVLFLISSLVLGFFF